MNELYQEIYKSLQDNTELVIATIISDSGSTPRTSGSKMIVYRDGSISGTIGGGAVEGDVIQRALKLFSTKGASRTSYNLNQTGIVDQMDLICGGNMEVLLEHTAVSNYNKTIYRTLCEHLEESRSLFFCGRMKYDGDHLRIERGLYTAEKGSLSVVSGGHEMAKVLTENDCSSFSATLIKTGNTQYLIEPILPPDTVYLIGAGHVSVEIARFIKHLGFRTFVFDDREEFANTARYPQVDGVYVSPGYAAVFDNYDINPGSYIIIVTRGHSFDKNVLAQALQTDAGYIGMIGSRKKKQHIYQTLINEGFSENHLKRVFCPIGISIDAETPAEIGISIAAQLIQHRAVRRDHG